MDSARLLRWLCPVAILAATGTGCLRYQIRVDPPPLGAQAISLVGDTLWAVRFSTSEGQERVRLLVDAQRRARAQPGNDGAQMLLARRTADIGRFREALEIYNELVVELAADPRVRRRRGELLLLLREPDKAVKELTGATELARRRFAVEREYVEGENGQLIGTGVAFGAEWLLGVAHYVRGDFPRAVESLSQAVRLAADPDETVLSAVWLYFALRQSGNAAGAATIARAVPADAAVTTRRAELNLLLALRGAIPLDSLRRESRFAPSETGNLYRYGVAVGLLTGDQREAAVQALEDIRLIGAWGDLAALAAEADLARELAACPGPLPRLPNERRWDRCRASRARR
ncbi:MAG: hypothetical protein AB7L66_18890 [Gemmatimonadales bacterium]